MVQRPHNQVGPRGHRETPEAQALRPSRREIEISRLTATKFAARWPTETSTSGPVVQPPVATDASRVAAVVYNKSPELAELEQSAQDAKLGSLV